MITNLQLLRALAALAVVFCHTGFFRIDGSSTDFLGVCVFFVISGFIMTHVSRSSVDQFMTKRLVRIVPLYWLCTLVYLMWGNLGFSNPLYTFPLFAKWAASDPVQLLVWIKQNYGLGDRDAAIRLIKSLLFIPYAKANGEMLFPVLGVGWSLNLEMFFYVLFGAALRISQRHGPLLVVTAITGINGIAFFVNPKNTVLAFYAHPYTWCFVLGIGCFYVWRGLAGSTVVRHRATLLLGTALFVVIFLALNVTFKLADEPSLPLRVLGFGLAGIVVMLGLLLHSAGIRVRSHFVILLGNASYSLYLCHSFVMDTMRTLAQRWPWLDSQTKVSGMLVAIVLSIALALLVYRYVEMPLLALLRRWLKRRQRDDPAPAAA
ncbi:acyltransferase family protein [Cupriavidus pauculus]|uniref:acyltransferase family protein n=1 Tax=Cupriavidus pauculus TaxID=82633 RepID=UPI001FD03F6F|nr:acyltransferase [Cupriavidus pauculus]